jgi:hypothetical protein
MKPSTPVASPWILMVVDDDVEEARVLDELDSHERRLGGRVVPVLVALIEKVQGLLRSVRIPFIMAGAQPPPTEAPATPRTTSALPEWVVASPHVSAAVRQLVARVGRCEIVAYGTHPSRPVDDALFLVAPEDTGAELVDALEHMGTTTPSIGILFTDAGLEGRWSALKLLLAETVPVDSMRVVTSAYPPQDTVGSPTGLASTDSEVAAAVADADVVVFSGHADAWDGFAGRSAIFCARGDSPSPPEPDRPRLPCFWEHGCHRQERVGRDAFSTEALVPARSLRCKVLVLEGCNVLRLGAEADALKYGLVYQAGLSGAVAVVASIALMHVVPGADALLIGLLQDGFTLGQAVARVNRVRSASVGAAVGRALGPLLVVGNPRLRLRCIPPERATVEIGAQQEMTLTLPANASQPHGCAAVFDIPLGSGSHIQVLDRPARLWLKGAITEGGRAYLWARWSADGPVPPVRLATKHADPWRAERACWRSTIDALLGWVPVLGVLAMRTDASPAYAAIAEVLPSLVERFARAASSLMDDERILVDRASRDAFCATQRHQIALLGELLFGCALEALQSYGIGAVIDLEGREEALEIFGPVGGCNCGRGRQWGQRFALASRKRVEYQCDACGGIDVDSGRRLVRVYASPEVSPGFLTCTLEVEAPGAENVEVAWGAAVQPWLRDDPWHVSSCSRSWIPAGTTTVLRVTVTLPENPRPGLNRVCMLTIVNGALTLHQRSFIAARGDAAASASRT